MSVKRKIHLRSGAPFLVLLLLAFCLNQVEARSPFPGFGDGRASVWKGQGIREQAGLSPENLDRLARATVRIIGMKQKTKRDAEIYSGSGTILTRDGLILTNCHVANPKAMGYPEEDWSDKLVVALLVEEDVPTVPTYYADRLAFDPVLDLAVLKISKTLDGKEVVPSQLDLPYVSLGNSDNVQLGDTLHIFGYPSIGGDTITYTSGAVSGFDSEDPIGNRAWLKTSATIAGGNSGGLAADDAGRIIGVPTRGGTGSAQAITDCRRIADTNDDGIIDEDDTCVPMGGFINGVRPVRWALPLIEAAQNGLEYQSPYKEDKDKEKRPAASSRFTLAGWAETELKECPTETVSRFKSGIESIFAGFKPGKAISRGDEIKTFWFLDDLKVSSGKIKFKPSECSWFSLSGHNGSLPDGKYHLEIRGKKGLLGDAEMEVGGDVTGEPVDGGVTLQGVIQDANSGEPLSNIHVILLKPGVDPTLWMGKTPQLDVYSSGSSDQDGKYVLPDKLMRGKTYPIILGNEDKKYRIRFGSIVIPEDAVDTIQVDIKLVVIQ